MKTPSALLKFIAKALLNAVGVGLLGDVVVDVLPDVAEDVWKWWNKGRPPAALEKEVEALAQMPDAELREQAEQIAAEEAGNRPAPLRRELADYLAQVPDAIRRSRRSPADPSGRTVAPGRAPRRPADLLPFLPTRLPRFRPGDRPGVGDWQLETLLGVGGFGEVWKARNPFRPNAAPVALKFCLDAEAAKSLRNEVRLLDHVESAGRHPGIVPLLRTYLSAEPPCLEYEYVAGGDLTGIIQVWHAAGEPPGPPRAAAVVRELAEIVSFAHRLNPPIVHRDLKPANILIQPYGRGVQRFRITDFGIGGLVAGQALRQEKALSSRTRTALSTAARGAYTPLFASPQQMAGAPADPRDDVHALGVIWYQVLTGELTSGAPSGLSWADGLLRRGMSQKEVRLLASCFDSAADKRPADVGMLLQRLDELSQARTPSPRPPSKPRLPALPPPAPVPQARRTADAALPPPPYAHPAPDDRMQRIVPWALAAIALLALLGLVGMIFAVGAIGLFGRHEAAVPASRAPDETTPAAARPIAKEPSGDRVPTPEEAPKKPDSKTPDPEPPPKKPEGKEPAATEAVLRVEVLTDAYVRAVADEEAVHDMRCYRMPTDDAPVGLLTLDEVRDWIRKRLGKQPPLTEVDLLTGKDSAAATSGRVIQLLHRDIGTMPRLASDSSVGAMTTVVKPSRLAPCDS